MTRHASATLRILTDSVRKALAPHWGALLALALFLAAGLAVLDDYGVIYDASWQRKTAEVNLGYLAGGDFRAYVAAFRADHDKFYGMAFEVPLLLAERAFGIEDDRAAYLSRHLITSLFFLSGGLFAYMLARRLFDSRLLAIAAMLLFLLHPRIYAHSFFNPKDIPFLAMFMIALFLTHRAFRRDALSAFALLGVGVGILVNLRIMGVALLAAIPAMRALDLALASGWEERKRALLTTGGFALASALAIYALTPYLWADPAPRAAEGWTTLAAHPHIALELFRGTLYHSVNFPVEYLPVWFSITAPPFTLLLGAVGAAGVFVQAARAPREALRNERLRFALLLVACFAAPVVAVMLGASMYNGWRQMYFLWAPFSLLAAFGLQRLVSALGRRRLRAAAYGAAGAGFAATVISMALLHPNQQEHFNVLVDRVAPERLRSQYVIDYWMQARRQGGEWISEHSAQSSRRSYIAIYFYHVGSSWSRSARELHRLKVYGNTLVAIEWKDDLLEVYEAVQGREPVIGGAFDVHQIDGALALVMEPCAPTFVERVSVTLRAFPVAAADLPAWRRGLAFEPRRFDLRRYGARFEDKCVASLPLPAYPLADFELLRPPDLLADGEAREKARRAREEGRLLSRAAHRAAYDIYLSDGELAYRNDACDPLETARQFHLNVYPERVDDLPEEWRGRGFERFEFLLNGAFLGGGCAAYFRLPDYPVVAIRTWQRDADGGDLWRAEFLLDPERRLAELLSGASGEPIAQGDFDVHLADRALVYVKEPCEPADAEARFFLHVTPERVGDLPEERRIYGFDNLDFNFFPYGGALFDGRCAARASLPEYPVASVRTGQYDEDGEVWSAEFAVGGRFRLRGMTGGGGGRERRGAGRLVQRALSRPNGFPPTQEDGGLREGEELASGGVPAYADVLPAPSPPMR